MGKLDGKVAVVTGASKGIGAEIAKHLAAAGASVVVNYASSKEGGDRVVGAITAAGGKAVAVGANLADPAGVRHLFAETKTAYGRLDILVNNAGVFDFTPLEEITPEHFHKHFDLNVLGLLLATQEAVKLMGPEGGSVINISSVVATKGFPGSTVYTATKGAVDALTRALAAELGPRKIRVNAINPGMVLTEGVQAAEFITDEMKGYMVSQTPLGRLGQPGDIAPAVVYLASADSAWVSGETLTISGGMR